MPDLGPSPYGRHASTNGTPTSRDLPYPGDRTVALRVIGDPDDVTRVLAVLGDVLDLERNGRSYPTHDGQGVCVYLDARPPAGAPFAFATAAMMTPPADGARPTRRLARARRVLTHAAGGRRQTVDSRHLDGRRRHARPGAGFNVGKGVGKSGGVGARGLPFPYGLRHDR